MTAPFDALFLELQTALAGQYSIEREIGRGGMGIVYLAREVRLDRLVAIKLLPPALARDDALRERFLREARTAAKLSHPSIIPIHAVEERGGFVFFVMAYVEGETLTERIRRRGPLTSSEGARMLREIAWALGYAHAQGVIHRDIKPDNILLEGASGRVLVADFGIADAGGSTDERVTGTPEFMSPEQALGTTVDARSDLYSLGLTGYFALSGALPFTGTSPAQVLGKQVAESPTALAEIAPTVPRRIARALDRCLAKDPAQRPQSAQTFAEELSAAIEHRRELPVVLRAFVKHNGRLDGAGVVFYPFMSLGGAALVGSQFGSTAFLATLATALIGLPLGVLIGRARKLAMSGFAHADLEPAFRAELEQGREERAVEHGWRLSRIEKLTRGTSIGLWVFGAASAVAGIGLGIGSAADIAAISLLGGTILGILSLAQLQKRRDVDLEFYSKLWNGRVGRALFAIGKKLAGKRATSGAMTHRATELSIGLAAAQLYEGLPKETRKSLGDVPALIHRLEQNATALRRRHDQVQDALANTAQSASVNDADLDTSHHAAVDALRAERDGLAQQLSDVVAALETVRLDLLRLHAGALTVQSFTTDLGQAVDVAEQVERLARARGELDRLLLGTPTPA